MSSARPMRTLRRPMPGMPATSPPEPSKTKRDGESLARHSRRTTSEVGRRRSGVSASGRWMSADYSTTRLANFRLPVDLHDHYRDLVREVEQTDPRLRRPSLTEVIIALLEEGPQTPAQVAELLRRRRAAENESEAS